MFLGFRQGVDKKDVAFSACLERDFRAGREIFSPSGPVYGSSKLAGRVYACDSCEVNAYSHALQNSEL